jgi:glycine dehydrogenase
LRDIASENTVCRSYIGMGYHGTVTPPVIARNILENPAWYTQYTPYQAEISQGRLEALLNFQTMVIDLTGLPVANASLLDEGTAAAEAMTLLRAHASQGRSAFFVDAGCHPQTVAVIATRARPLGIELRVGSAIPEAMTPELYGALLAYPTTEGEV